MEESIPREEPCRTNPIYYHQKPAMHLRDRSKLVFKITNAIALRKPLRWTPQELFDPEVEERGHNNWNVLPNNWPLTLAPMGVFLDCRFSQQVSMSSTAEASDW